MTRSIAEGARHCAAVCAVTLLCLVILDRLGIAFIGASVWSGPRGVWALLSGHSVLAAIIAAAVGVVIAAGRSGAGSRKWLRASAVAIGLTLALGGAFLFFPSDASAPRYDLAARALGVLTLFVGLGTAFYTARPRRWWHYAPWALLCLAFSWSDTTVYPGLVIDAHLAAYAITALTATVGIGIPIANRLRQSAPVAHRVVLPALALLALLGAVPLCLVARGAAAAVSPQLERLVKKLPDPSPPAVLEHALAQAIPGPYSRPTPSFPRGKDRWSVLLVTVDALRADALLDAPTRGFYLQASDTPFLNQWLPRTFRFRSAYSQGNSTIRSVRSMFQAVGAADPVEGASIPRIARVFDLTTAAVVPPFFMEEFLYRTGLFEFEHFETYDLERQEQQLEQLEQTLSAIAAERSFVWTHFYCTHDPVYTERGPGQLSIKGASEAARVHEDYRAALRWFDRQFGRLLQLLEKTGRAESTLVVVASDHGEHVGDGLRVGHGDGMHAADLHVPLLIAVPGTPGGVIDGVVGNTDILPTIIDLLGGSPEPTHRGQSLVPLMQDNPPDSGRWYYARGFTETQHAIVTGDDLLVYDEPLGAFQRFPRHDALTLGRVDAFGTDSDRDALLTALLVRGTPELFHHQLGSVAARTLLARHLEAAPTSSAHDLDFAASLAALSDRAEVRASLERALAAAPSVERKLRIARYLIPLAPQRWQAIVTEQLTRALRTPFERETLERFAEYDAPLVAESAVALRLEEVARSGDASLIDAWLALIRTWTKPASFAPALAALVAHQRELAPADYRRTRALLESTATLELSASERASEAARSLSAWARSLVSDPRVSVAQYACRALAAVGTQADVEIMERVASGNGPAGVRSAALRSLTKLKGVPAAAYLKERITDPVLAVTALDELVKVGDEPIAAWLETVAPGQKGVLKYVTQHSAKRLRRRLAKN